MFKGGFWRSVWIHIRNPQNAYQRKCKAEMRISIFDDLEFGGRIMSQMFDSNKNLVQIIDSRKSVIFTEDLLELEQYLEKIVTTSKVPHKE
uniref:Uncharacterized protein n=1 Tax=Romanomermis culicivorax TaxID=13658 RepID=A0A915KSG1_ROMCU